MPVPDFQSLMLAVLKTLVGDGEPSLPEVRERITVAEGLFGGANMCKKLS